MRILPLSKTIALCSIFSTKNPIHAFYNQLLVFLFYVVPPLKTMANITNNIKFKFLLYRNQQELTGCVFKMNIENLGLNTLQESNVIVSLLFHQVQTCYPTTRMNPSELTMFGQTSLL